MNEKMPRTPLSTHLSGSARETEIRIRNIMSGPKKRPPVLFLVLMFSVCIFCGNLVSCQVAEAEAPNPPDSSAPEVRTPPAEADAPPQGGEEERLLQALLQAAEEEAPFQAPAARLLNFIQKDGYTLAAAFVEDYWENTLILGVVDKETGEADRPVFRCSVHSGAANAATFRDSDGEYCLLYTLNGQENGQYDGEAGVVRFNGRDFTWVWPVEGDARYPESGSQAVRGAREPYQKYWGCHLALPAPGGVDVYTVNPDFVWGGDDPWSMWQLDHGETFCADPSSADLFFPYDQTGSRRSYDILDHGEKLEQVSPNPDVTSPDKDDDWDWHWDDEKDKEAWEKEQEAKQIAEYQSAGVTMDGKNYYYQGQLVNIFLDQRPNKSVYTLDRNPAGTVNVKILRSDDGTITGAAYLTEAEAADLFDDEADSEAN